MRSRLVSPAMEMSSGLAVGMESEEITENPHIVLLRTKKYNGYYCLSFVSVLDFDCRYFTDDF
jgi:hypothetical protein